MYGGARPREEVLRERELTGQAQPSKPTQGWKKVPDGGHAKKVPEGGSGYSKLPLRSVKKKHSAEPKLAPEYKISNPFGQLA